MKELLVSFEKMIFMMLIVIYAISIFKVIIPRRKIAKDVREYHDTQFTMQEFKNRTRQFNKYLLKISPVYRIMLSAFILFAIVGLVIFFFFIKSIFTNNVERGFLLFGIFSSILGPLMMCSRLVARKNKKIYNKIYDESTPEERELIPVNIYKDFPDKEKLTRLDNLNYKFEKKMTILGLLCLLFGLIF